LESQKWREEGSILRRKKNLLRDEDRKISFRFGCKIEKYPLDLVVWWSFSKTLMSTFTRVGVD
jgi:hypothetical protein